MENQRDREFVLPKNIRQMGKLGETYKIYVEDFVSHQTSVFQNAYCCQ